MRLEKTGRLASVCLGVMSLVFGAIYPVIEEIGTRGSPDSVFRRHEDFLVLYCLASVTTGVLAIITGRSLKSKYGVIFGHIGIWLSISIFIMVLIMSLCVMGARNQPFWRMETLTIVTQNYCEQNEGVLPDAEVWCDQLLNSGEIIEEFSLKDFAGSYHLGDNIDSKSGIGFNGNLDGYSISDIDRQTVLLFETDLGWNQYGKSDMLRIQSNWLLWPFFEDGDHFVFVGPGSTFTVKFVKNSEIDDLNWEPTEQPAGNN